MKQLFTIIIALLVASGVFGQTPEKISYQAVVRNNSNILVIRTQIGMQVSILQGSFTGTAVYTELHNPTTNANGLVSIEIGAGSVVNGSFEDIDWSNGPYFIKTETDPTGGRNYTLTGTSQLLSVPYALHAKTAEKVTGKITETDPVFGKSVASVITAKDTTKWNKKLDSYTETDPAYIASQASKITAADLVKLSNLSGVNTGDQDLSGLATTTSVTTGLATKVDKETGKGLSFNDYTSAEKTKLSGIASGAEVNINADWNATSGDAQILNKPAIPSAADLVKLSNLSGVNTGDQDLSGLATTISVTTGLATKVDKETGKGLSANDYTSDEKTKLSGIASGAEVNVNADWNATSGDAQILNKPAIPTAADLVKLSNLSGVNTGDQDLSGLATTTSVTTGLATKVDKETGKGLSTNDYTSAEKTKLSGIASGAEVNVNADWNATSGDAQILNKPVLPSAADLVKLNNLSGVNTGDQDLSGLATTTSVTTALATKVDKETGKGLSSNDYTSAEKTKLSGIASGAEVNINADWNATSGDAQILNKPAIPSAADLVKLSNLSGVNTGDQDLSGLATTTSVTTGLATKVDKETGKGLSSNDYTSAEKTKLSGIASGAEVNVNADWNATSGDAQILNKPVLPSAADLVKLNNLSGVNTGDQDLSGLATTTSVTTALATKVDKETGKGLSSNDYTSNEKTKLASIAYGAEVNVNADWNATSGDAQILNKPILPSAADLVKLSNLSGVNTGDQDLSGLATTTTVTAGLATKVDKETGKGLSANDYTSDEKTKLSGIASGAEVNVNADWNATSGDAQILNKPTIPDAADGSETKVTAGTNVTVTGAGTTASPYVINSTGGGATFTIGQAYQGGIIFWLDATGQHGLIAAKTDQATGIPWSNGVNKITGTTGGGVYAGAMNTAIIIATQVADNPTGSFAARACADYVLTAPDGVTYGDWYLPSNLELIYLYNQRNIVGNFAQTSYWSSNELRSTEINTKNMAQLQNFATGSNTMTDKSYSYNVRAIRAF